jgi:hypothetical protein
MRPYEGKGKCLSKSFLGGFQPLFHSDQLSIQLFWQPVTELLEMLSD